MQACRISNWNVREGQRAADAKAAANLELEENPLSFSSPHLLLLLIQLSAAQFIIPWILFLIA